MEKKKSDKVSQERNRPMFIQIGLVVTLSIILAAFEWSSNPKETDNTQMIQEIQFEDEMMITRREEPKPPEAKLPEVKTVIEIVDDEFEVEDFTGFDMEVDDNTEYNFIMEDEGEEIIEDDTPFYIVEDMPKFNGGDKSEFWKYAMKKIRYPEVAAENGVSGTVHMQFTVSKTGDVVNVIVVKGVHPDLDEEAIRVIKNSPKWEAGKQRGRAVPVIISLPMKFILQ